MQNTRAKKHKLYGRKTGWCNTESRNANSHKKCDGVWWRTADSTVYCSCACHDKASLKRENALKFKREVPKQVQGPQSCPKHPKYGAIRRPRTGCQECLALYEFKQSSAAQQSAQ